MHRLAGKLMKLVTFLPEWKGIVDGDDMIRRADQKPGYILVLLDVLSEHFVTSVVIRKNHTLDNDSKKYLEALGLTVDLFSHSCVLYELVLGGMISWYVVRSNSLVQSAHELTSGSLHCSHSTEVHGRCAIALNSLGALRCLASFILINKPARFTIVYR